jgi:hypothetical protein
MSTPQIAPGIDSKDADDLKAHLAIWSQGYSSQTFDTPFFTLPATTTTDKYITPYLEVSAKCQNRCNALLTIVTR